MSCTSTCIQPTPSNAHCGACHVTYGSVTGFDRHRRAGECLNPRALDMHADRNGVWRMNGTRPHADEVPTCGHCLGPLQGYGAVGDTKLCHPDTGLDCYSLVTVSGHPMPCDRLDADRRYCEAVDDFFADLTAGEAS